MRVSRNRAPVPCSWGWKLAQPLWKTVRKHLEQLKAELLYDPAIPLLGISPKTESRDSSRYTSTHVHSSIIHNTPTVEANRGSTDGQMDKHDVMHLLTSPTSPKPLSLYPNLMLVACCLIPTCVPLRPPRGSFSTSTSGDQI